MNIGYRLKGTKEYKKIYVRLYHNQLDLDVSTNLVSSVSNWDSLQELYRRNKEANAKLLKLKMEIENRFNTDYSDGTVLNSEWLKNIVSEVFLRPNKEEKMINHAYTLYIEDFGAWWIKNKSDLWINANSKPLDNKAKSQKTKALEQFAEFQKPFEKKIKLSEFTEQEIRGFYHFLIGKNYLPATAKKTLSDIKFLCKRAKELKFSVCLDFESKISFADNSTKVEDVYLNEQEIALIFNHDFSDSESMDIIRDNFILSLWTGMRISDLRKLGSDNLINGIIENINQKTKTLVQVPLHPHVKSILSKRFGSLPPKVGKDEYNTQIKEICRLCGIDKPVLGRVFDADTERKVLSYYPKYKLVSSHTARRSFGTNLSKVLSVKAVAKLGGWKSEKMAEHYNKETNAEIVEFLKNHWNENI